MRALSLFVLALSLSAQVTQYPNGTTSSATGQSGGGTNPTSNGIQTWNTSAWNAATFSNLVSLFGSGSCSGYLKADGTCSTPNGATWGAITGTLSNQTDLNSALNLLAPIASPAFTGSVSFGSGNSTINSTGTQLVVGSSSSGASTSPASVSLGATTSSSPGAFPKLLLYPGYGVGVSSAASLEFISPFNSNQTWWINSSKLMTLAPTGLSLGTASNSHTLEVGGTINASSTISAPSVTLNGTDLQTTLNTKQSTLTVGNFSEATSGVLTITGGTGAVIGSGLTVQVKQASTSQSGYLSSTDWNTFNGKQAALTLPLSIANGGTGTASPGLVAGTNISVTGSWPNQTVASTASAAGLTAPIEEHTASASSELDFTSCLSSSYDTYQIRLEGVTWSGSSQLQLQFSTNGGTSYDATSTNYSNELGYFSAGSTGASTATGAVGVMVRGSDSTLAATGSMDAIYTIFGVNAARWKHVDTLIDLDDNAQGTDHFMGTGMYKSTSTVNAFRFNTDTGATFSGKITCSGYAK